MLTTSRTMDCQRACFFYVEKPSKAYLKNKHIDCQSIRRYYTKMRLKCWIIQKSLIDKPLSKFLKNEDHSRGQSYLKQA